jgi:hypothetical protein
VRTSLRPLLNSAGAKLCEVISDRICLKTVLDYAYIPQSRVFFWFATSILPGSVVLSKVYFGLNMDEYKVEKSLFPVKVFFLDGTIKEGSVYLSLHAARHEGRETVRDVLNHKEQFIPIKFEEEQIGFINKTHIMMMSFPLCKENTDTVMPCYMADVEIDLANKTQKEGIFVFQLPEHLTRVKDFLNHADLFVELRIDQEIYLINKDRILSVREK